jgi:hypothetical protein
LNELGPAAEGQSANRFLASVGASGSGKSSVPAPALLETFNFVAAPAVATLAGGDRHVAGHESQERA